MTTTSKHRVAWAVACAISMAGLVVSCQEPQRVEPVIHPPATAPASEAPKKAPRDIPMTPIKMEKPRMLGPVSPAIVMVPEEMAEPAVRVRLTEEEDRPPVVKKSAYRGRIETVQLADGKYVAVNVVPMDAFLAGVLPKELYGNWSGETYRKRRRSRRGRLRCMKF